MAPYAMPRLHARTSTPSRRPHKRLAAVASLCPQFPLCSQLKDEFLFQRLPLEVVTMTVACRGAARNLATGEMPALDNFLATIGPCRNPTGQLLSCKGFQVILLPIHTIGSRLPQVKVEPSLRTFNLRHAEPVKSLERQFLDRRRSTSPFKRPRYGTSILLSRRTASAKKAMVTTTAPATAVVYPMARSPLNGLPSMPCMTPIV